MRTGIVFSIIGILFVIFASFYMSYLTSGLIRGVLVFPIIGLGIVLITYGIILQKSYKKFPDQRIKTLKRLGIILVTIEGLMSVLFFTLLLTQEPLQYWNFRLFIESLGFAKSRFE